MGNETKNEGDGADKEEFPTHWRAAPEQLVFAESVYRRWWLSVPAGTPQERVLDPRFLSRCVQKFSGAVLHQPPDRIEIMPTDRAWYLELLVLDVGAEEVRVMVKSHGVLPDERAAAPGRKPPGQNVEDFEFRDLGPVDGWAVVRKHDSHVMQKMLRRGQCASWLGDYLRTVHTT
jgi:hypothetical protein